MFKVVSGTGARGLLGVQAGVAPSVLIVASEPAAGWNSRWGMTPHTRQERANNGESVFSGTGTDSRLWSRGMRQRTAQQLEIELNCAPAVQE